MLRSAHKGLLFLDEIGELGLDEQAMLFKAIEEKRFLPVGADVEAESDFQLIAGTHRDLAREVAAGRFREDLFARIKLWSPPHRQHGQLHSTLTLQHPVSPHSKHRCFRRNSVVGSPAPPRAWVPAPRPPA